MPSLPIDYDAPETFEFNPRQQYFPCTPLPAAGTASQLQPEHRAELVELVRRRLATSRGLGGFQHPLTLTETIGGKSGWKAKHCVLVQAVNRSLHVTMDKQRSDLAEWDISACSAEDKHGRLRTKPDSRGLKRWPHKGLRLQMVLRLLEHALLHELPADTPSPDFELVYCPTDSPPSAWNLPPGSPAQRRFRPKLDLQREEANMATEARLAAPITCADSPLSLPLPEWGSLRHPDLVTWDELRRRTIELNTIDDGEWALKHNVAVFRGSAMSKTAECHNFSTTGLRGWAAGEDGTLLEPMRLIRLSRDNWQQLAGRPRLLYLRNKRPDLLDVNFSDQDELTAALGIDFRRFRGDDPHFMTITEQRERYRLIINAGRNSCWADRLRYLLLSSQAVVRQHSPCGEYWEELLRPYVHFLPTDSNFDNLTDTLDWAQAHDPAVRQIVRQAQAFVDSVLSVEGIYFYTAELLRQFSTLFRYPIVPHPQSRMFRCPAGACRFVHRAAGARSTAAADETESTCFTNPS